MTPTEAQAFATSIDRSAKVVLRDGDGPAIAIGPLVLLPRKWLEGGDPRPTIVHECAHVRQYRWCGLGIHPWVGVPIFFLLYGLVLFPVLLAWARYRLELAAYEAEWRFWWCMWDDKKTGADWLRGSEFERVTNHISGLPYFFAVPRCWARWGFRRKLEKVLGGE